MTNDILSRSIELAARAHRGQVDKSGQPYILHPLRVMQLAIRTGLPLHIQCAAVLHDVLEDTMVPFDDLAAIGVDVVTAVRAVTRREDENYFEFIDRIAKSSSNIIELKLCDIGDNTAAWRLTTPELRNMAAKRYVPARTQLAHVLMLRRGGANVKWPADRAQQFNASNEPCDMWTGPCCCGAWHREGK